MIEKMFKEEKQLFFIIGSSKKKMSEFFRKIVKDRFFQEYMGMTEKGMRKKSFLSVEKYQPAI